MGLLQLKNAQSSGQRTLFGAAQVLRFPDYTLSANETTPINAAQIALPCNVKIIALAALATAASGTGLAVNISSGPGFGTFPTGTVTFTGTAGATGTATLSIQRAGATVQTVTAVITSGFTATQSAAALVAAINTVTSGAYAYATNSAGVVTLYLLNTQTLGALTYSAALATVTTQTVAPGTATAFSSSPTAARGTPDTTGLGIVPSTTAAAGQFLFSNFQPIPIASPSVNTVKYPGQLTGYGADWDIIFPCNRSLTLVLFASGQAASTVVQVSVLVVPIILDPTQTHATQWAPNNTTIGCPSTD